MLKKDQPEGLNFLPLFETLGTEVITLILLPLADRNKDVTGALCLLYTEHNSELENALSREHIGFSQALSGFCRRFYGKPPAIKKAKAIITIFH